VKDYIVGGWKSLSERGRAVVAVVLLLILGALLGYTMFLGYDWSWLKDLL
jgi:hypothetical protein